MEISKDRLNHILAVANKMRAMVESKQYATTLSPEDAFILGFLHDIGYAFAETQVDHAKVGGEMLKKQNYPFWQAIYFHGMPQNQYCSNELTMLNIADMTTGPDGKNLTVNERISDIEARYGKDSKQAKDAILLAKQIGFM